MYEVSFSVVGEDCMRKVIVKARCESEAKEAIRKSYEVKYMFWAVSLN